MTYAAGLGIAHYPFSHAGDFWRWVDLCEAGGVNSIWQSERIVGSDPSLDSISVMAALAGRTRRMRFGMNVASLGLRHPVLTARACATIDVLSEGRLLPAFGIGSALSADFRGTGTPTRGRGQRMDEGLEIMTRLWRGETLGFDGSQYQLEDACIAPLPVQTPMPLWIGGSAAKAIERTARWGTGWQAGIETPDEVAPVVAAIASRSAELGRPIDADHYGAGFAFHFGRPDDPAVEAYRTLLARRLRRDPEAGYMAVGEVEDMMVLVRRFRDAGIHKFILRPLVRDGADYLAQTRRFVEELVPAIQSLNARERGSDGA